jgi:hypothetical protein
MRMKRLQLIAALALAAPAAWAAEPDSLAQQRAQRAQEIAFFTTSFDGGAAKFDCAKPAIPPISKTNAEITAVDASVQQWFACYNRFAQAMNEALPVGKAIPESLAKIMTAEEMGKARKLMDHVYGAIGLDAEDEAKVLMAEHAKWRDSTTQFATTKNAATKAELEARLAQFDLMMRQKNQNRDSMSGGKSVSIGR